MESLRYFAYGSNLLFARLHARCPSIVSKGIARLDGYRLSFDKPGGDGSGKCGIIASDEGQFVLGVLYDISAVDKDVLDIIEGVGHGYEALDVVVSIGVNRGEELSCFTYEPTISDASLMPFDWYRDFVLYGAKENGFPVDYIERIAALPVREDPDTRRRAENIAILQGA